MVLAISEHAHLPATIYLPLVWASGVFIMILLSFGARLSRPASLSRPRGRRNASVFVGLCFLGAVAPLYPLARWRSDEEFFGQLFGWLCAHGLLAVLYSRMGVTMLLCLRRNSRNRETTPTL